MLTFMISSNLQLDCQMFSSNFNAIYQFVFGYYRQNTCDAVLFLFHCIPSNFLYVLKGAIMLTVPLFIINSCKFDPLPGFRLS